VLNKLSRFIERHLQPAGGAAPKERKLQKGKRIEKDGMERGE